MSNTRYTFSELLTEKAVGKFITGRTSGQVTIVVENLNTNVLETLSTNICIETTTANGVYQWPFSNLSVLPATFTQYLYTITDSVSGQTQQEVVDTGGYVQSITGTPLGPADTCTVTVNLYEADGTCTVEPIRLFGQDQGDNWIRIKDAIFLNDRYFKLDDYKPSYDRTSGVAYWILPQGANTRVKLDLFGIDEDNLVVPTETTIDLNAWILLP